MPEGAPDRSAEVRRICAAHPEAFGPPPETNDARRLHLLTTYLVPSLNLLDDHQWGVLRKDDQRGKVPCDVIVWFPTREHFDVLTGDGATWIAHGPVPNPDWHWEAVPWPPPPDTLPLPVPVPEPPEPPVVPVPRPVPVPDPIPGPPADPDASGGGSLSTPGAGGFSGILTAAGAWVGQQAVTWFLSWWAKRKQPKPVGTVGSAIPRPLPPTRARLPK